MKKAVGFFLILLSINLFFAAGSKSFSTHQNKPDFSGTWVVDFPLSGVSEDYRKKLPYDELTFIITHQEPELRITRKLVKNKKERVQEVVYYTDGRGEKRVDLRNDKILIKSKTTWEGNKLVSKNPEVHSVGSDFYHSETTESFELSPDSKTLIYLTTMSPPLNIYGRSIEGMSEGYVIKRVFKRVP
jgi:hypothetical protein